VIFFEKFSDAKLIYIVENADWVIYWVGKYITDNLNKKYKKYRIKAKTFNVLKINQLFKISQKILHFGSRSTYLPDNYKFISSKNNAIIFTWYHGLETDKEFINSLPYASKKANIIHTACTSTKNDLIRWGAEPHKIEVIPLGVDLNIFIPGSEQLKQKAKQMLGIPKGYLCIGSFQKDGVGWGEGFEPKLEKGPDIFCEVLKQLNKNYPVFVLLTGPARGYVKNKLTEFGIPFVHHYIKSYSEIVNYYHALDYYIIASRVEGGPLAILECFATKVPFVTTKVGMVNDIIKNNYNGLISEIEDVESLKGNLIKLIEDNNFKEEIVKNGYNTVKNYDWSIITEVFFKKIYSKFL